MNTDGPSWFALSGAWPPRPLAGDRIQPPNGRLGDVLDAHPRRLSAHRCRMIQRISTQLLDDLRTNVYAVQGSKDSGQLWPGRPSCKLSTWPLEDASSGVHADPLDVRRLLYRMAIL